MAGEISLKIKAEASQAIKELQGVEKAGSSAGRTIEGVGRAKGKQGAEGVGLVNRELERLVKNTDSANKKVRELEANLKRVGQQKGSLMGFVEAGAASPAQLKELEALRRYGSTQSRSLGHWQQVATDRQEAAGRVEANQPEPPGRRSMWSRIMGGASDIAGGGVKAALPEGAIGDFMGGMAGKFLGPLAMVGVGAAAAKMVSMAYDAASREQKSFADFIPRQGLGGAGYKGDPAASMGRLRDMGRPLGYSGYEMLQIQGAMSTGGSKGLGLKADTLAAAQFSRVMGVDGAQAGTMLAEGQKTGAFKSGDAKRFAEMLAQEIAITGLGPRAQETQEATLSLLNQQLQTQGQSTPATMMALQSILNKTGIPALQGAMGGNTLAAMNNAVVNPGSDANVAINQLVYQRMGIHDYYKMQLAQEKGIAQKGFLPNLFGFMESRGTPREQDFALRSYFHNGLSMTKLDAMRQGAPGHSLARLFSGKRIDQITAMLTQGGVLDPATAKAMGLPGNQLRKGEATLNDLAARAGTPIVKSIGTIADYASKQYTQLLDIAISEHSTGMKFDRLLEHFTGAKAGTIHVGQKTEHAVGTAGTALAGGSPTQEYDDLVKKGWRYDTVRKKWWPPGQGPQNVQTLKEPEAGFDRIRHWMGFKDAPGARVKGYREDYQGGRVVRVIIEEHGMVSHASHQALHRAIHAAINGHAEQHQQVNPKSNYRGHR